MTLSNHHLRWQRIGRPDGFESSHTLLLRWILFTRPAVKPTWSVLGFWKVFATKMKAIKGGQQLSESYHPLNFPDFIELQLHFIRRSIRTTKNHHSPPASLWIRSSEGPNFSVNSNLWYQAPFFVKWDKYMHIIYVSQKKMQSVQHIWNSKKHAY